MIVFVHLYNDRSGSPRVLSDVIKSFDRYRTSVLFIGSDGDGILSTADVKTIKYPYKRYDNRLITMVSFFFSQVALIYRLFFSISIPRNAIIYVNTLLPFGAAIFGKLTSRRVVYHLHEVSLSPKILQTFLKAVARMTADTLIYVSEFHRTTLGIGRGRSVVINNSLDAGFFEFAAAHQYEHRRNGSFSVLMLASARHYKGLPEFVALAERMSHRRDICFDLVLSSDEGGFAEAIKARGATSNLEIHPATMEPSQHYQKASLVLNLSRPDLCQETFGLTLLEAMAFGIPVIAPPVGGPVELIDHGREGFLIDCRDSSTLDAQILLLADNEELCLALSGAARKRAARFEPAAFRSALTDVMGLSER